MRRIRGDKYRVAIGRGSNHVHRCDSAAAAGNILDQDRAAEACRHASAEQACQRICRAAGGEGHNEFEILRWIALRVRGDKPAGQTQHEGCKCLQSAFHGQFLPQSDFAATMRSGLGFSIEMSMTMSSSRKDSALPCPSRPRLELTPPSNTSSSTKLRGGRW